MQKRITGRTGGVMQPVNVCLLPPNCYIFNSLVSNIALDLSEYSCKEHIYLNNRKPSLEQPTVLYLMSEKGLEVREVYFTQIPIQFNGDFYTTQQFYNVSKGFL